MSYSKNIVIPRWQYILLTLQLYTDKFFWKYS